MITKERIRFLKNAARLFAQVPISRWAPGSFSQNKQCCPVGTYQRITSANPNDYSLDNCNDYKVKYGFREAMVTDIILLTLKHPPRKTLKYKTLRAIRADVKYLKTRM